MSAEALLARSIEQDALVRGIPACVTLGIRDAGAGALPGCVMDGRLAAACEGDGRLSRGACLVLADQGLACGVYATLPEIQAMMTLDLRIDWHGALPAARAVAFATSRAVTEGALCFVEGMLLADGHAVAAASARFLVGAMPGGRTAERPSAPLGHGVSGAASFTALAALQADGERWRIEPEPVLTGARAVPAYHGGFVAGAMELACARLAGGQRAVDFEVRYLRPARSDQRLHVGARAVRGGRLASVLEAEARQGETLVAVARALYSGVPAEPGVAHRFDR